MSNDSIEILSELFLDDMPNSMCDMHDNESLHDVIEVIHIAWQIQNGVISGQFDADDILEDILAQWDKALNKTFYNRLADSLLGKEDEADFKDDYGYSEQEQQPVNILNTGENDE